MQFDQLKRREFITLLGGAAATASVSWPHTASAQQAAKPRTIGFMGASAPAAVSTWVAAFVQRLRELGWIEGRNVAIEYRWAEGRFERLAGFAADFVRQGVDIIVAEGTVTALVAKQATAAIPIVFPIAGDPVGNKLVASLARPGGNVTGLSIQQTDLAAKRLELFREIVPDLVHLAIMANAASPNTDIEIGELRSNAPTLGLETAVFEIRRAEDIAPAFEAFKGSAQALYVPPDPLTLDHRAAINTLALGLRLPTMYAFRDYVEAGGLMSYGPNISDLFRRTAEFVDKILRGAKPGDIPVEQPTKFELVINLKTAKALGLTVPLIMQMTADEVIE
jgi:putative tryptophan/tyrosine transport system substrate-binding protein